MPEDIDNGLKVELLGPVRAGYGPEWLSLGPARQRAVFAVLALRANTKVSSRELLLGVWGESAPASAAGSVHTYVSGLRRCLDSAGRAGRDVLTSVDGGYLLKLAPDAVDVVTFGKLRAQAAEAGEHHATRAALDAALDLWHGEALSGVPGPFAEVERRRLAEARLEAAEERAAAVLALGGHHELAAELAALVRDNPLRESARELLMLALYRSGRPAEALEVFRDTRSVFVTELGVEPSAGLRRLHQQMLSGDPALDLAPVVEPLLSILPAQVSRAIRAEEDGAPFVGRAAEVARLRTLVSETVAGRGRSVWIEGAPGVGKSELLTYALADAGRRGCQINWVAADEMARRIPLHVMFEALGIDPRSPDSRRAKLARELQRGDSSSDPIRVAVDRLLSLVDELCARSPVVLVVDDLQWADEASVQVWRRLSAATRQLPLLLVAISRPLVDRPELARLRQSVETGGGEVLLVEPLGDPDITALVTALAGANPGPGLQKLVARAAGNPLYLCEMVGGLTRSGAVEVSGGVADIDDSLTADAPQSLVAAVQRTLDSLSETTREVLRMAAMLGREFALDEIRAMIGRPLPALHLAVQEAVAAHVLFDEGGRLAFRHPLLRQALHDGIPAPMRGVLYRQSAKALADSHASVTRVAEQLVAAPADVDPWVFGWLAGNSAELANRAPLIAIDLLEQVLEACPLGDPSREELLSALVRVAFRLGRNPEAEARQVLSLSSDAVRSAEMSQLLAAILYRQGQAEWALQALEGSADDPAVPEIWRVRHRTLLAHFRRGDMTDIAAAAVRSVGVYTEAVESGDPYAIAHALQTKWQVATVRRDHRSAIEYVDSALEVVRDSPDLAGMCFDLLDNKVFTLHNLDRLDEAEKTLRLADELTARHALPSGLQVSAAVHYYWAGRWEDALVELDTVTEDGPAITYHGLVDPGPAALLLHGLAALIAGRRNDRDTQAVHLAAATQHVPSTAAERESCDFLLVAQGLDAMRRDDLAGALTLLEPIVRPEFAEMMLRHQWLPELVRMVQVRGDVDRAHELLAMAADEAAKETVPARAYAAHLRCQALVSGDPEPALAAAEHYRRVSRPVELAQTLEEAAALLAESGRLVDAEVALTEAVELYSTLKAQWDIRRAESRLEIFGVRRGRTARAARSVLGWQSLSPVEKRIAKLVAAGKSNPDIAAEMPLPRRTVQAHVTRVLGKLQTDSRLGIAEHVSHHLRARS
jgi:DNA-binding SARP family transcriptional activator/DNA-binding CsgD family transcriptional regulator/tetratricopeptide (TPR) repeat protein